MTHDSPEKDKMVTRIQISWCSWKYQTTLAVSGALQGKTPDATLESFLDDARAIKEEYTETSISLNLSLGNP